MSNIGKKQSSIKNDESKLPKKKLFRIKTITSDVDDDVGNITNKQLATEINKPIDIEPIKSTSKDALKELVSSEKTKTPPIPVVSSKSNELEEKKISGSNSDSYSDSNNSGSISNERISYTNDVDRRTKNIDINQTDNQRKLKYYITKYFESLGKYSRNVEPEFEIKFGTKGIKPITKIDYDNVIKILKDNNYNCDFNKENELLLRCQTEFINPKTGTKNLSSIRMEIKDIYNI
jgi:hypothetical protein